MVAVAVRTIFAQPDAEHVREQLDVIATMLGRQFPKVEAMLREAAEDITAFADFPVARWKKIWLTNPLDGSTEIKCRTDVVGVFPTPPRCSAWPALIRIEVHHEWQVSGRHSSPKAPWASSTPNPPTPSPRHHPGGRHHRTHRVIVGPNPLRSRTRARQLQRAEGRHRTLSGLTGPA